MNLECGQTNPSQAQLDNPNPNPNPSQAHQAQVALLLHQAEAAEVDQRGDAILGLDGLG